MISGPNLLKYIDSELKEPYYTCTARDANNTEIAYDSSNQNESSNPYNEDKLVNSKIALKYDEVGSKCDEPDSPNYCCYNHQRKTTRKR